MKINKIKSLFFIIYALIFFTIYGENIEPNIENIEDYYVQLNIKELKDDFFMIKYDYSTDEIYIPLNSFFYFLELYDYDINIDKKKITIDIDGEETDFSFKNEKYLILDDEVYLELNSLKKKFNFNLAIFSSESLRLTMEPSFELPYEKREQGKIERLRLDLNKELEEKKNDIEMPSKLITPGLFKLEYSKFDTKHSDYDLNFEYASQLAYGEFYLSGQIKPDANIDYGNLTYSKFIKDNDLVLGSFSMITPSFLDVENKVIGLSLSNSDTYLTRDGGITIIKGEALNAESIELYRNGFLLDYLLHGSENFRDQNFEFRIDDGVLNSNYLLKIYYKDGKMEERKVFSLSNSDLLKKGKDRFNIQVGKIDGIGEHQGIGNYFYGITDNLTLGIGGMKLVSSENTNYNLLENDIIFKTGTEKFPLLFQYKNYYDYDNKNNSFESSLDQKIYDYNLRYTFNKYSKKVTIENGVKEYKSVSLGKNFGRSFLELGLNKIKDSDDTEEKNIYGLIDTSFFSPFYTSLKIEKSIDGSDEEITYNPYISYVGNNGFSIMADTKIITSNIRETEKEYSLRAYLRRKEIVKNKMYADLGFEIKCKENYHKPLYGFTFDIELDDFIYSKINSKFEFDRKNKASTNRTGVYLSKIIDLSDPKRQINKNISLSNSWIYGKVFLDKNNNGIFDKDEKTLPDVGIMADNVIFYSNKDGDYIAEGLYSSEIINLKVDRKTIDPMTKFLKDELKIKTKKSSGMRIDIPINIVSMIAGNIWNTEDFTEKEFTKHLTMTTILLEKNGKIVSETTPEFDGMFFFEDVTSGEYTIKFKYVGRENIKFSNSELKLKIDLTDTDDGEYFDGFDTTMVKSEETK